MVLRAALRVRPGSVAEQVLETVRQTPGITLIGLVRVMRKQGQCSSEPRLTAELTALLKNGLVRRERPEFVDQWRHFIVGE